MSSNGTFTFLKRAAAVMAVLIPVVLAVVFVLSAVHAADAKATSAHTRIDGLDARFDRVDDRLDRMDGKLGQIYRLLLERK